MTAYILALLILAQSLWQTPGTAYPSSPIFQIEFSSRPFPTASAGYCTVIPGKNSSCPFDCILIIGDSFFALDESGQLITILHEFGHCLGLPHFPGGVMSGNLWETPEGLPSPSDLAQKRRLWPYPHRYHLPISRD